MVHTYIHILNAYWMDKTFRIVSGVEVQHPVLQAFKIACASGFATVKGVEAHVLLSRYERSQKQPAFGRSLVQRHVALPEDLANEAGEGFLVSSAGMQQTASI